MIDVQEILNSSEMDDVIRAVDALRSKFSPQPVCDRDHEWPVAIVRVGRFKAKMVLKILLSDEQYYPGYKEVLAAAFGGWLLAPRNMKVREALMTQAAMTHMENASSLVGNDEILTVRKDIATRYLFVGPEFLVEVYDCLGGYQAFADAPSFDELWKQFDRLEKPIATAVRAIAYLHHAVDRFGRPGFQFVPSLNKAVSVFDELKDRKRGYPFKDKYVSRSLLHQRWSQNKQTLALLYAASSIQINRKTLLRLILDGFFSYEDHNRYFQTWIGRARYVADHIFARMGDVELDRKTRSLLGDGPAVAFKPSKLDEKELVVFNEIFRSYIK